LQRHGRVVGGGLQVGDVALQFHNALLLLAGLGLSNGGLAGGVGRSCLRLLRVLLRLLPVCCACCSCSVSCWICCCWAAMASFNACTSAAVAAGCAALLNREASWLKFNWRVLEEAGDLRNPLLERVKFLAISASNLDEFFEVRVGGLLQQLEDGHNSTTADGLTMVEERELIKDATHEFVEEQYSCWNERLRPELAEQGIRVLGIDELDDAALAFVDDYCERELDPLLTPVTVDPAHPFPRVINKALCVALLLRRRRRSSLTYTGVVTVPRALPRLAAFAVAGDHRFHFSCRPGRPSCGAHVSGLRHCFFRRLPRHAQQQPLFAGGRIAQSAGIGARELHNRRRKGDAVRMEIESDADPEIIERLGTVFELDPGRFSRSTAR
jgi:polyphosphate kinase